MAPEEHVPGILVAASLQLLDSLKLHSTEIPCLKGSQITQHRHVKTSLSSSMYNVFKKHFYHQMSERIDISKLL